MSEKQRKTFKYRLYPNKEQEQKLLWTLDRCRELYNAALEERKSAVPRFYAYQVYGNVATVEVDEIEKYPKSAPPEKQRGLVKARSKSRAMRSVTKYSQSRELTEIKHDVRPEYQEINDHILRDVLDRVDKAFDGFFRRCKAGQTPGYPRFQGKNRYDSFTTNNGFKLKVEGSGNKKLKGTLHLFKVGSIKVQLHRKLEGQIKTCTIKREGTQWYVTFSCEIETKPCSAFIDDVIGIDVGLKTFATLSTGEGIPNPRYYRKTEQNLEKVQQELARKQKPHSKPKGKKATRRQKVVRRLASLHRKATRQRRDFLHKQSRQLVNTYDTLVFEKLQIANLVKRPKPKQDENGTYLPNGASAKAGLNKSISDAGWGMFVEFCTYKAEWAGRAVLTVNPRNTSQICSRCGVLVPKPLEERIHNCPHCGLVIDRDVNGAINIRTLGIKALGGRSTGSVQHVPPQKKIEAGSVSAFGLPLPLKRRRASRAAESDSLSLFSQGSLWHGSTS